MLTLKKYAVRHRLAIGISFTLVLLSNSMMLIGPMILKYMVDDLNQKRDQITREKILLYALLTLGVALVGGLFRFGQRSLIGNVARRIEYELRGDFFQHLQKMQKSYFDQVDTGDLMSRATNDLDAVHRLLGFAIIYIADATVFFGFALAIMLRIDITLTMLALIPYPILAILVQFISKSLHDNFERIQEGFSKMNTKVQENLSGVRVVRAYTREQSEIEEFDRQNLNFVNLNRVFIGLEAIFFPIFRLLPGLGAIVLLWLGGLHVIQGKIMLGDFVAFNAYLTMLIRPVIMLGFIVNRFAQGTASIDRINLILNQKPEICDEEGVDEKITELDGEIEFRHLTFAYFDSSPVLKDINFKIEPGSTVAIVGATGAGKTTLVDLIPRIYQPERGSVFIDGTDIRDIPLKTLRTNISMVQQESFLFSDLLKNNIAYGADSATETEIRVAAHNADLLSQIDEFPNQFDTHVGERGKTLSGGQKQRTAIARAIMTPPKILILDDAFANVDTHTEDTILDRLKQVGSNCTTILISHRISTVKAADQIVVLHDGRIVETGTHQDLVSQNGIYANTHQKQLLKEEIESL
ncbi:TPA: ABC transporter ATP-binding protein [Candidatus Poribacteria bacterium]|nr:ABC transporter ATP-binding protein [Candidatus Poribacteria bacterium]HIB92600.1 ABC transporter ATP-binding protein [Candidatus Poribacteria bacterium]HIN28854.1 ABC transporter ATP-binding protein [Candidatus Poribacteria bacterium]HIO07983.1 ABC transporter ATP-binding protein [Candidatus Poribacteria bacterium]HIO47659.1 ABC transporter ATP-binding protein [Candidatus Poribacteria bacterium]